MSSQFWDVRYRADEHAYGREPNGSLRAEAHRIPHERVLCLAEGEGRNAVFLAGLGHEVTAVDFSTEGLRKAERLARDRCNVHSAGAEVRIEHLPAANSNVRCAGPSLEVVDSVLSKGMDRCVRRIDHLLHEHIKGRHIADLCYIQISKHKGRVLRVPKVRPVCFATPYFVNLCGL